MLPREHYLKQPFQDLKHFPKGFEQDAQLSALQARLIRKHGALITALLRGEVSNPNAEDHHLLKVIERQAAPKNPVEQAWLKYRLTIEATQEPLKQPLRKTA